MIKKTKKPAVEKTAVIKAPAEWLYCAMEETDAQRIASILTENGFDDTEVWPEAGVVEIPLAEKASMDMEWVECDLEDDYSNAFLTENQVKCLYMVTIVPDAFPRAREVMLLITEKLGGFFCGDTEDFTPSIGK